MERPSEGWSLIDGCFADLGGPRTSALLSQLDTFVPWEQLAEPIRATYRNQKPAVGGRPNVPVVLMLKGVVLAKLYNLSDPALEEQLRDRISFRRFLGLAMTDPTPDQTSFVRFRERLIKHGLAHDLFEAVKTYLQERDLILQEGTIVDATIIQTPRGRDGQGKPSPTADRCAVKRKRPYFGYKAHIATDLNGIITDYVYDTAKVAEIRHMDQLIQTQVDRVAELRGDAAEDGAMRGAVFADSAYMDFQRKKKLTQQGVFCGVIERRGRSSKSGGKKQLSPEQRAHNRLCAGFRAAVEHPFAMLKNTGGFHRTRYRGLTRNALDFCLGAITMNLRRGLSLLRHPRSRPVTLPMLTEPTP